MDLQLSIPQTSFPSCDAALALRSGEAEDLESHFPVSVDLSNLWPSFPMDTLLSCQVEDHRGPRSKVATFFSFPH